MVGYNSEHDGFALELTANYGIESYEKEKDLRHIAVRSDLRGSRFAPFRRVRQVQTALELGYEVYDSDGKRIMSATGISRYRPRDSHTAQLQDPSAHVGAAPCMDEEGGESAGDEPASGSGGQSGSAANKDEHNQATATGGQNEEEGQKRARPGEGKQQHLARVAASGASVRTRDRTARIASLPEERMLAAAAIHGPDDICYKLASFDESEDAANSGSGSPSEALARAGARTRDPFSSICLSVRDLSASRSFWRDLLGMEEVSRHLIPGAEGGTIGASGRAGAGVAVGAGARSGIRAAKSAGALAAQKTLQDAGAGSSVSKGCGVGSACLVYVFDSESVHSQTALELIETGSKVKHGSAFGRIAFSTRDGPRGIWDRVKTAIASK